MMNASQKVYRILRDELGLCPLWGAEHVKAHERLKLVGYDGVV